MRLGAFEVNEPVPELKDPHALAILRPWIDVGNAGSLTLSALESHFNARELASLARPGDFFDFTRYRPTLYIEDDHRAVLVPNSTITYAREENGTDFLFLRLLEPHMLGEDYVESVLAVLQRFGVKRYVLLGSMYDMVPYTRPLLVSGIVSNLKLQNELETAKVVPSEYAGPTTIAYLISQKGPEMGIETTSLVVHLPQYLTLENDYRGKARLMEVLSSLYGLLLAEEDTRQAREQEDWVRRVAEHIMQQEPKYRSILEHLEASYDARVGKQREETQLSPELEQLLQDLSKRFGQR
jgi:predicted ATP-grasp superfamily ATP-dependent carboligase